MKRIIKISLILLLVGMAVIAVVPFLKEKRAERKYENEFKKIQESVTDCQCHMWFYTPSFDFGNFWL